MDNLTHSLVAASLGRVGLADKVPGGTASLVVVANVADLDVISSFWGELYYLAHHRGITHSILGTVANALPMVAVLWLVARCRGHAVSPWQMGLAVCLTAATHPLLDLTNSYGLRPFLPFQDHWYYGDLVFIVDPYMWLLLGGAVFLAGKQNRRTRIFWAVAAAGASFVVLVGSFGLGLWLSPTVWILGIVLVIWMKQHVRRPLPWGHLALAGMVVYWGILAGAHWLTLRQVYPEIQSQYPWANRQDLSAIPRPANPFDWDVYLDLPEEIVYARVSPLSSGSPEFVVIPRNRTHPAAQAAMASCPGAIFTQFARFEVFEVTEMESGPVVTINDVRYTRLAASPGFGTITIDLNAPEEIPCPKKIKTERPPISQLRENPGL